MEYIYLRWVASTVSRLVFILLNLSENEVMSKFFHFSINSTSNGHCWRNCYKWRTASQKTMYWNNWKPGVVCRNRSKESFTRCVLLQSSKINFICFFFFFCLLYLLLTVLFWYRMSNFLSNFFLPYSYSKPSINKYWMNEWMSEESVCNSLSSW